MRASCYIYNTPAELDLFVLRLKEAIPRAKPVQEKVGRGTACLHACTA
jgi:hypothetical protein